MTTVNDLAAHIARAIPAVQVRTMSQFNLQASDIMGKLDVFLLLTVGLALLVGGVGIANTMLMSLSWRIARFPAKLVVEDRPNGLPRKNRDVPKLGPVGPRRPSAGVHGPPALSRGRRKRTRLP